MFGELLESRAKPVRNRAGMFVSSIGHAAFIALAVAATRGSLIARAPEERIVPLPSLPRDLPAQATASRASHASSTSTAQTAIPQPLIRLPLVVLPGLPPIDDDHGPLTDIAWQSDGPRLTAGIAGRSGAGVGDGIPFEAGVDKPAMALSGNPSPRYPDVLRRANIRGEVVIQVVIDTTGHADMTTLRIISSDHPLLTEAVTAVLPKARFLPAESGGRKVPMWAVQSFVFEVR